MPWNIAFQIPDNDQYMFYDMMDEIILTYLCDVIVRLPADSP